MNCAYRRLRYAHFTSRHAANHRLVIKSYFPSYFAEKGKNLATKEDIGKITAEVEKVRLLYAVDLEKARSTLQEGIELIKHQLSLSLESSKRYEALKAQAYVDFIRGVAGVAMAQRYKDTSKELEFSVMLADAKARIAIYGSKDVLIRIGQFFEQYGALTGRDAMLTFLDAIQKMREESITSSEWVPSGLLVSFYFHKAYQSRCRCEKSERVY